MHKLLITVTVSTLVALCASPSLAATLGGTADPSSVFTTGGDVTVPINPTFDPMTSPTGVTVPGADVGQGGFIQEKKNTNRKMRID
jgi:hypothetical protein